MNAARAYRRLKEVEEKKLANRVALLKVVPMTIMRMPAIDG
jgi:hypothetical protein